MFDTSTSIAIAAIGFLPPTTAVIVAQGVPDAGVGHAFAPWTNLAAVTVIVGLFAWLLIYHIPGREKCAEERQDARDLRADERMDRIHREFLAALANREESSRVNAAAGHKALHELLVGQKDVMQAVKDVVLAIQHLDHRGPKST